MSVDPTNSNQHVTLYLCLRKFIPGQVGGQITVSIPYRRLYLLIASPLSSFLANMICTGSGTSA